MKNEMTDSNVKHCWQIEEYRVMCKSVCGCEIIITLPCSRLNLKVTFCTEEAEERPTSHIRFNFDLSQVSYSRRCIFWKLFDLQMPQ